MAIYLDEDMAGADATVIAFPHLLLCMGVVLVMGDGTLIGAHFTRPSTEQALLRVLLQKVRANGSGMDQLYCLADVAKHVGEHGGLDINGKAAALGFHGDGYNVDFGFLKPTDGTYAQVTSNGAGARATVRCKLNQHMGYTFGKGPEVLKAKGSNGVHVGNNQGFNFTNVSKRNTSTIGATTDHLNTPFLQPVTIA